MTSPLIQLFERWNSESTRPGTAFTRPYIIAEAGVNHEGSLDTAYRLIDEAKQGGADAIKFQSYRAETLASRNSPAYWDLNQEATTSQYELFKKHDSFWKKEFEQLKIYCDKTEIEFLSTPFDLESADFLNDLMVAFKISSSDITNKPFIKYITGFNKPIILSTGASALEEIDAAKGWIDEAAVPLALLHCVLNYPTEDQNAHLGMIHGLKTNYPETIIGYSDHTFPKDMEACIAASLLGAVIIEKHFSHDKSLPGNDHYHAMDWRDLKHFNERLDRLEQLTGSSKIESLEAEEPARLNARRSLVAATNIPAGTIIEDKHLTWKRPAHGISPAEIDNVIGKTANRAIAEDELLQWEMFL